MARRAGDRVRHLRPPRAPDAARPRGVAPDRRSPSAARRGPRASPPTERYDFAPAAGAATLRARLAHHSSAGATRFAWDTPRAAGVGARLRRARPQVSATRRPIAPRTSRDPSARGWSSAATGTTASGPGGVADSAGARGGRVRHHLLVRETDARPSASIHLRRAGKDAWCIRSGRPGPLRPRPPTTEDKRTFVHTARRPRNTR